ncbi:beta-lactamase family protein [Fulvivirga maritima]|uniref:serine hydrolase domain-containing protein n=1 Tax=Fulvivirga maritima TaxID=2904247 RepID=UPI001F25FE49|nr:serine hydrolase domain-containing protein [Fulvivirga maritima]UII24655.1 beta-lactamase family protein [Fulvivirga maritima]
MLKIRNLLLVAMLSNMYFVVLAQDQKQFTANGKEVIIADFNQQIHHMMDEVGVPGASVAIINENEVVFAHNYGFKNLKEQSQVDRNTLFEAASLSKSFLVYAAFKMVKERQLNLDKPMYEYMPHEQLAYDERYKLITPRMILSHSSGIENWKSNNNSDSLEILAEPGTEYIYSGEGYNYLAKVMANIRNQTVEELFKETVYQPLGLKNTYSFFMSGKDSVSNYAIGHDSFKKAIDKWKSKKFLPSTTIHTTAADYAKLIVSIFDGHNLSTNSMGDMLEPIIPIGKDYPGLYYGAGFEVSYSSGDTVVFQAGSNDGFKAQLCYSITKKRGVVLLTNSDRGTLMTSKINEMTSQLNLEPYFGPDPFVQYPSNAIELLKAYNNHDSDKMFTRLEEMKVESKGDIGMNTLNELAWVFMPEDIHISKKMVEENIKLYPESSVSYYVLGKINMAQKEFGLAYKNLKKAEELEFDMAPLEYDINYCAKKIGETNP